MTVRERNVELKEDATGKQIEAGVKTEAPRRFSNRDRSEPNERAIIPCSIAILPKPNQKFDTSTKATLSQPSDINNHKNLEVFQHNSHPKKILWKQKPSRWCHAILSFSSPEDHNNDTYKRTTTEERYVTVDQIAEKIFINIQPQIELVYEMQLFVSHWEKNKTFANTNPTYKDLAEYILSKLVCQDGKWSIKI
mmetsp:Transcript_15988/g.19835  ORF Transcript_15988/g.19835 Transcript_15988/m.19835 type:complete len:194 (-) Transcript_15988:214-795(-)|eukprot:CAMPEP_0204860046 /NCGR_PEP_ID=MMETSP1347-20130617/24075_1 /ASSEMBLY_ACC=CAM_ASM_000690 /TAXON_ID=215587 /ORGANISM="Aplanochytrium stocchinoi, Strain GSBS06" /LENGTH=193 /DNA_ID=CAMNT_0052008669 /DNA_START=335 /DNA_END=916 /DNA_ORIENTATION=+